MFAKDVSSASTNRHPCSVETLRTHDALFAVGAYELQETANSREGEITIMTSSCSVIGNITLSSGVLDMKTVSKEGATCLLVASSSGCLTSYKLLPSTISMNGTNQYNLEPFFEVEPPQNDSGLALSIDYSLHNADEDNIFSAETKCSISYQNGSLAVFSFAPHGIVTDCIIENAHSMRGVNQPAWIVAFSKQEHLSNVLISGGDDCRMKLWDLRCPASPTAVITTHEAGVTSAQWHPVDANIFVSGSYDEHVRIWDYRILKTPLMSLHTGGGVWRTKWRTLSNGTNLCTSLQGHSFLATACMQCGSRVDGFSTGIIPYPSRNPTQEPLLLPSNSLLAGAGVRSNIDNATKGNSSSVDVSGTVRHFGTVASQSVCPPVDQFSESQDSAPMSINHLAYGIDFLDNRRGSAITEFTQEQVIFRMASCSFYDNKVFVWDATLTPTF